MSSEDPRYKDYHLCFRDWNEIWAGVCLYLLVILPQLWNSCVLLPILYRQLALKGGWHSGGLLRDRGTVPKQQKWFMDEGPCPAHPEEQVIARDCSFCLSLLSKVVGMNRQCQTALCLLCRQCLTVNNTEDLADFLSITGCASVLAQTRKGLVQQKFGGHFLISLNWNSGTSRLGLVLLLGNTYIELPLFQPDTRLQCNLYYL